MQPPPRLDIATFDPFRTRADDLAARQGYIFDPALALYVETWIETMCRLKTGRWRGEPLRLMAWQQDYIYRLYGWVHKDSGLRRFDEAYLEVAKKNGKSPLVAAQAIYHLVGDGEGSPEVYVNACSREQASIIYKDAVAMVRQEPELDAILETVPSQKRIVYDEADGLFVANSSESDSKDGVQASFTIFDELHRQPNDELWKVFQYAGDSRLQPLLVSITTAGRDQSSVCYQQHLRALAIESGASLETRFLGIVHGPREKNPDIDDPKVWRMANPSMGVTIDEEKFRGQLEKAKQSPAALANFKRLKLNIWTKEDEKFIDMARWWEAAPRRGEEEIRESGDVWCAGLDMSITTDLTAYVRVAGNLKDGVDVFTKCWVPEATAERRSKEEGVPYLQYAEDGFIELIPGEIIDQTVIQEYILQDHRKYGHKYVLSDFRNTNALAPFLVSEGVPFQHLIPGAVSLNFPTKAVEALYLKRMLRHGDDPMLSYCAENAVADARNKNENLMLVKGKSTARIDAMTALVNAVAGLLKAIGLDGFGGDEALKPKPVTNGKIEWF